MLADTWTRKIERCADTIHKFHIGYCKVATGSFLFSSLCFSICSLFSSVTMDYSEIKGEKKFLYFGQAISCPSNLSWKIIRGADKEFGKQDVHHSAIYNDEKLEIQMSATKKKINNYGIFL